MKGTRRLILRNEAGKEWRLDFKNFLSKGTSEGKMGVIYPAHWSEDGRFLFFTVSLGYDGGGSQCFFGGNTNGLFRIRLSNGSIQTFIPPYDDLAYIKYAFSPDGKYLAIRNKNLVVQEIGTGKKFILPGKGVYDLSWSPDGSILAYTVAECGDFLVENSSFYFWDAEKRRAKELLAVEDILLKPDGWVGPTLLKIIGEQFVDGNKNFTVYEYNVPEKTVQVIGTATPRP